MLGKFQGRNGSGEFARRSMANLDFILAHAVANSEIHPVTQAVGALLGIVVFPWERSAFNAVKKVRLAVAMTEGWPQWKMSGTLIETNSVKTVGDLIELLRHSVSHGNVSFDSDSRVLSDVAITFENCPEGKSKNWRAMIAADQLVLFCRKFSAFVADYVS